MKTRRYAREAALQALYQCDAQGDFSEKCAEFYFSVFVKPEEDPPQKNWTDNLGFARMLVDGVLENLSSLDAHLKKASTHWNVERMSRVDRNILRIATFEIGCLPDVPPVVSINEAVEIAKRYGSEESPMFINGVLDKLAGILRPAECSSPAPTETSKEKKIVGA